MTKFKTLLTTGACFLLLTAGEAGCEAQQPQQSAKMTQAQKAQEAANSVTFTDNTEIDNLKRRLEMNAKPGGLQYIVLLNQMGQPVAYDVVSGKITSSGKRLTRPDIVERRDFGGTASFQVRQSPSDTGTYGSSDSYIFYWTAEGAYRQWNGSYLLSDQPIRLSQPTLVVTTVPGK